MTNCWNEDPRARLTAKKALESFKELQEAEIQPKLKPVPPPRSPSTRPLSQSKAPPPTKPKPSRRPKRQGGASVCYHKEAEAESVDFELKEKK